MQPKYTPEQKKLFPDYVGVIVRKGKPDLVIDMSIVGDIIDAVNSNDFVFIRQHNTTVHKFDIEEISIKKVGDDERSMILRLAKQEIPTNSLSLDQCIAGVNSQNQFIN